MTTSIKRLEAEIEQKKIEIVELERKLEKARNESPERRLAKDLHGLLCTWNHTDGCSWYYETKGNEDDWNGYTHSQYLKKAQKFICDCERKGVSVDKALEMYSLVKEVF